MKKAFLSAIGILFLSAISFAQDKQDFKFSVGAELAFATGNLSNTHSIGIGATALVEIPLQEKLNGVAYGGFILYNGKSVPGVSGQKYSGLTIIPVRVGVKYFLTGSVYGCAQAGVGFLNRGGGTAFSYSPQIGYEFKTNSGKSVDVTVKYDAYSKSGTLSSFGFRLAYIF